MHFPNIRTIMAYLCLAALPCSAYADNYLKVKVKRCGTLSARVKEAKLQRKQGLRIEGTLNNADLAYLRKLCGRDTAGNAVPAVTHQLDLQQVTFATGGKPFLTKDNTSYAITSAHAIPAGLFDECPIDSVLLPALTDSIGTRAFANTHIRTVKLPDYVVLAKDAYKLNMKLTTVYTGKCHNVSTDVLNRAFAYCNNLSHVEVSDVDRVPSYTFVGWPSLRTVNFNGITGFVAPYTFSQCPELQSIHFNHITLSVDGPAIAAKCDKLHDITFNGFCLSAQCTQPEACQAFTHYTNNALIINTLDDDWLANADSTQRANYKLWPETYASVMQWGKRMLQVDNPIIAGQAYSIIHTMHVLAKIHNFEPYIDATDSLAQALDNRQTAIYRQELIDAGAYDQTHTDLPAFVYDTPADSLLQRTRRLLKVDSIAGQGSDIDRMKRIMTWLHDHIRHDGSSDWPKCAYNAPDLYALAQSEKRSYNCRFMAIMLCEMYQSVGIPARYLVCVPKDYTEDSDCHVICVAWSDSLQKWVWMDPTWDAYVMDENGVLLHPGEVRERLVKGSPLFINDYANWNHENKTNVDEYLRQYMCKNLYYINTPLHFGANNEGKACRWQPQYITLKGVNAPGYFGSNTTNADYFWQSPR